MTSNLHLCITGDVPTAASKGEVDIADVPWGAFVRSPALWSLLAVHCSHGVAPLICLSWMPSYYAAVRVPTITMCG